MARALTMPDSLGLRETAAAPALYSLGSTMLWAVVVRTAIFAFGIISIATATPAMLSSGATGHAWVAYDGYWYVHLIQHGYPLDRAARDFYVIAFFPVLPLLAKPLAAVISPYAALVVMANVCSLIGFGFFYSWIRNLTHSARTAFVGTLIVATYPGAVFYSAALTEGPFFLEVALTLWLLQRRQLYWAALVCAVATLTRPTGVALAITVAVCGLVQLSHVPMVRRLMQTSLIGLIAASGGMAYEAFLWHRFGTPDAYFQAQAYWEREDQQIVQAQRAAGGPARYSFEFFKDRATKPQAWNRIMALGFLVVLAVGFFKPGPIPRLLFVLPLIIFLMTALPNHGLRSSSILRYESAGLPVFALLGVWLATAERRTLFYSLVCAQFAVQIYYAVLFSRGIWVG